MPPNQTYIETRTFYGWWIVTAAFINLFFTTGIIFYGFPVFYPSLVASLGFTRAEATQGFLLGFLVIGIPFGLLAGALIDRIGARWVILPGIILIGIPLILLGHIAHLWQYDLLCVLIVIGYTLAGPISNQVLVAQWFRRRRGRAMGYAYLGLGLGGVVAPWSANSLIRAFGWRHALEITGAITLLVLLPVGLWITRSTPAEMGLLPDGASSPASLPPVASVETLTAMRTGNFWLLLLGCTLVMGSLNTVIQHIIFFLMDQGYTRAAASHLLSALLVASLAGRVAVGHIADRFRKKNTMALFYLILGGSIPLLYLSHHPAAVTLFAAIFGFTMGADYMLIPLVTAECFGIGALGKLLAIVIMGYSLGQWIAPWLAGVIFDQYHSYNLAWAIMAVSGILGAGAIALIKQPSTSPQQNC